MNTRSTLPPQPPLKREVSSSIAALAVAAALSLPGCKPADTAEEPAIVTEVAVQVALVKSATLHTYVEAYGSVESAPAGVGQPAGAARLSAPVPGLVTEVLVTEGEHVDAGRIIVKLDDRLARSSLELAAQQFDRQKKLMAVEGTSEKMFQEAGQQLAAARTQLALLQITTPTAGIVARVNVQPGQVVDMNTVVSEIVDPSRLVVTVNVPAAEAALLKTGQAARYFIGSAGTPAATGGVYFISPQIDPKTGTTLVRLMISADSGMRPGQLVRARIVSEERAGRLTVPLESVVTDVEGHSIIAVVTGDTATQQPVKTGVRDGGLVEVEGEGLKEGDTVVTVGAYGLPEHTRVKIVSE